MAVRHANESTKIIHHAINNRLNTLTLGMSYLENKSRQESCESQTVLNSLKMELRDLQELIEQLKSQPF